LCSDKDAGGGFESGSGVGVLDMPALRGLDGLVEDDAEDGANAERVGDEGKGAVAGGVSRRSSGSSAA
jgi:hypothetical protein